MKEGLWAVDSDEEDLALFQDLKKARERNSFLQALSDESDESVSTKLGSFSSFKFYVSSQAREKNSDLLNTDIGKTDYNWLLTPPGTPLFPSLDQETPLVDVSESVSLQSKPISIPRKSRIESSPRRIRSSSSPQHSSPVSCSSSINNYRRGRASSVPSSSGSVNFCPLTPTLKSSSATARSSTPPSRSSTSTFQTSTTSSGGCSSSVRKTGPLQGKVGKTGPLQGKVIRGGSSSPKLQVCRTNVPNFYSQPDANLHTTISDYNVSRTRGLSPVSRHGREMGKDSSRQPASPNFSRTARSSENHDRYSYISQSKRRTTSSDNDVVSVNKPDRMKETYVSKRTQPPSKGSGRSVSTSNVSGGLMSKRSSNSGKQQTALRQSSQNMFRPLLSNAPVTSFYANKATTLLRRTNSSNLSGTTSSQGSCEQISMAPVAEIINQGNKDLGSENSQVSFPGASENIPVFEKMEVKSQNCGSHCSGCVSHQSKYHESPDPGSVSVVGDQFLGGHDNYDNLNLCENNMRDVNDWTHGKLSMDRNAESLPSDIGSSQSDNCQHGHIGHPEHAYQVSDILEGRITSLDPQRQKMASIDCDHSLASDTFAKRGISVDLHQREASLKFNNDSQGSHPTGDEEDTSSHTMGTKNVCDGKCKCDHVALQRKKEVENIQKLENGLRENIITQELFKKQDLGTCSVKMSGSVGSLCQCLQDQRTVQSSIRDGQWFGVQDVTMTGQVHLGSDFQREECTCSQDRDNGQSCSARENLPAQDIPGKGFLECKAELSSRSLDSFKCSSRKANDNWQDLKAEAFKSNYLPGNDSCLGGSWNGLKNDLKHDENTPSSMTNNANSPKSETNFLSQTSIRRVDTETSVSKVNLEMFAALTPGEDSNMHQAQVLREDTVNDSVHSFDDVLGERCSLKSKTLGNAFTETKGRTNGHQGGDLETYSGKDTGLPLQEISLGGQRDEELIVEVALERVSQESKWLLKQMPRLETQDQRYSCPEGPELSENSGCSFFENNMVNAVTEASSEPPQQEKECRVGDEGFVTIGMGDSILASGILEVSNECTYKKESELCDSKQESAIDSKTEPVLFSVSSNNLGMDTELCATSEGWKSNDTDTVHPFPDCDKAQQAYVSQGDNANADAPRGYLSRSMTLEEATDTVLFCSSIVHDLVYKVATTAMEKEPLLATPIPTVTRSGMSHMERRKVCREATVRRTLRYQTIKSRQTMAHLHTPSNRIETTVEDQQPVMHVKVGERNRSTRPKKENPKCCCTVL